MIGVLPLTFGVLRLIAAYPIATPRYLADPSSLITKDRVCNDCSNDVPITRPQFGSMVLQQEKSNCDAVRLKTAGTPRRVGNAK